MQQDIALFFVSERQKQSLMRAILTMCLNQSVAQLYQTYKNHLEKIWSGLLIQW